MVEETRIIPGSDGERRLLIGNRPIGYIDEDSQVIVFENEAPKLLGVIDHYSEAIKLVDEWRKAR